MEPTTVGNPTPAGRASVAPVTPLRTPNNADIERLRELQRISQETEQNYETLQQQLQRVSSRIHAETLKAKRAEAAVEALQQAGPDCVAYRQISRLFVLTPPKQLEKQLTQERQHVQQKELPKLDALKQQLVARLRSVVAQRSEARKEYEAIVLQHYPEATGNDAYAAAAARTAAAARAAEARAETSGRGNT